MSGKTESVAIPTKGLNSPLFFLLFVLELSLHMSNVNVEVKKNSNENVLSLVRRFQKRVQESGVLPRVRGILYNDRPLSVLKTKRAKLKKLWNIAKYELAKKMGKVIERKKGGRR
jgi:hypothetical protein